MNTNIFAHGALTLSGLLFHTVSENINTLIKLHTPQLPYTFVLGFRVELLPFQSPLLRESQLVSFPPLINMLKFSGLSIIRDAFF